VFTNEKGGIIDDTVITKARARTLRVLWGGAARRGFSPLASC